MARIFLSYSRADKHVVGLLAAGLKQAGHEVWWDTDLKAGGRFRDAIEAQLAIADVVIVAWSKNARTSRYVADEADRAAARGVLLPVGLSGSPPLGFGSFHMLDFSGWSGDFNSQSWRQLLSEVERIAAGTLQTHRPAPQYFRHTLPVAAIWSSIVGVLIWITTPGTKDAALGYPLIDSLLWGMLVSVPVSLWSGVEAKRSGFESASFVARRSLVWFGYSAVAAVIALTLPAASGILAMPSARGTVAEVVHAFVSMTAISAFVITLIRLGWFGLATTLKLSAMVAVTLGSVQVLRHSAML